MKTSKRILSFLLAVIMCISLMPAAAFADYEEESDIDPDYFAIDDEYVQDDLVEEPEYPIEEESAFDAEDPSVFPEEDELDYSAEEQTDFTVEEASDQAANAEGNVSWAITENGTLEISGTGNMFEYGGPETQPWYQERETIERIVVSEGITSISAYAFCDCENAQSISLPSTVTDLGPSMLHGSTGITEITIPKTVISARSFPSGGPLAGSSIIKATIEAGMTAIPAHMFEGAEALTQVIIPESVTSFDNYAFSNCLSLTNISFPQKLETIGDYVFSGCMSLGKSTNGEAIHISVPDSVQSVGNAAFQDCISMEYISFPKSVTELTNGLFSGCSNLQSFEINDTVTTLGPALFKNCPFITQITVPKSVGIAQANGPDGGPFGSSNIKKVILEDGMTAMPGYLLDGADKVTTVVIPESVSTIGEFAFCGAKSLKEITLPKQLTSIGRGAFKDCTGLTSVTIPKTVTELSTQLFSGCKNLTTFTINDTVTTLGAALIEGCPNITEVFIPKSVIVAYANGTSGGPFGESYIDSATLESGIPAVPGNLFSGAKCLKRINIPKSVTKIGIYSFKNCTSLYSIIIPENVAEIGYNAFANCDSLSYVIFLGDAPVFAPKYEKIVFENDVLTAYTPVDNPTWTSAVMLQYGGTITWVDKRVFTLGVDNNSFEHWDNDPNHPEYYTDEAGFVGVTDHSLDDEYFNLLTATSTISEIIKIKIEEKIKWAGSCYGVSATMALLFDQYIGIEDLTTDPYATSYYTLPYPCNDAKLLNTIEFYHLSQFLSCNTSISETYSNFFKKNKGVSLSSFLEQLSEYAASGQLLMLGYCYFTGGHEVLVTGYEYDELSKEHILQIYDINDRAEYRYMRIKDDFSSFFYGNLQDIYTSLDFQTLDNIGVSVVSLSSTDDTNTTHVKINFEPDSNFTVTNADGAYLTYSTTGVSGDLEIYDMSVSGTDENIRYVIETDASSCFTVSDLSNEIYFEIYNDNDFLALEAQNIDAAVFTLDDGIELQGSNYSFSAYVGMDAINERENGLLAVTADAASNVSLSKQGNTLLVEADEPLNNIITSDYVGVNVLKTPVEPTTEFTVNANSESLRDLPVLEQEYIALTAGETATIKLTDEIQAAKIVPLWASENDAIAIVDENGKVTAVSAGTTYVQCYLSSIDAPARCRIDVTENTVANSIVPDGIQIGLAQSAASLNLYSTDYAAVDVILMLEQNLSAEAPAEDNGVAVTAARFDETVTKNCKDGAAANEMFDLRIKDDRTLVIVPKADALSKVVAGTLKPQKTYTANLIITIGETEFTTSALKLTVSTALPKLKAAAIKINISDNNSVFPLKITGADVINLSWAKKIEDSPFVLDGEAQTVTFVENLKFLYKASKMELLADIKGYAVSVPVTVSYSFMNKAPVLKLKSSSVSLVSGSLDTANVAYTITPTEFTNTDKYKVELLYIQEIEKYQVTEYENGTVISIQINNNNTISVSAPKTMGDSNTYTYKAAFAVKENAEKGEQLGKTVILTVKALPCTKVVTVSSKASGSIDTAIPNSPIKIATTLKNFHANSGEVYSVYVEQFKAKTKTTAEIRNDVTDRFAITQDGGTFVLTQAPDAVLESGYTYNAYVSVDIDGDGTADYTSKAVKLGIKWSQESKVPVSVTLKSKGSIDPIRPESAVTITPTFKNWFSYTLQPEDLVFTETVGKTAAVLEAEQLPFNVSVKNGSYVITEKAVGAANPTAKYTVKFAADVKDNGTIVASKAAAVTMKLGKTLVKQSTKTVSLIKADRYDTAIIRLKPDDGLTDIASVTLDKNSAKYYSLEYLGGDQYAIGFKDNTVNAKAASITAKLNVVLEGTPAGKAGAAVSVKINLVKVK